MKKCILVPALMILMALPLVGLQGNEARAHAVHAQSPSDVHPQVVAFEYATGDIPAYVQVEVYAPGETEVEFQNGRTDALGRFTFTPDKPGVWTIVMGDGMGHQLRHEVTVSDALFAPTGTATQGAVKNTAPGSPSMLWKALLGVSILCNIFLGLHLWRRRVAVKS